MKKMMFLATMVAAMMVCAPASAQTRKDKKAAQKAQWEQSQQQQAEEAALRHQMKMDSLRAAQKAQEEAVARAKAKEEAAARAAEEEEQYKKMTRTVEMPCQTYDDADWFYATGVKRFTAKQTNLTPTTLLRSTRQQLLQKLQGKYQQVIDDYFDQMEVEDGEYARQHIESAGRQVIQQLINETYEVCRKQTQYPDNEGYYTMYMAIKVSKKEVVEKTINQISNEQEMKTRFNEKQFRDSAFKVFEEDNKKEYDEFKQQQ